LVCELLLEEELEEPGELLLEEELEEPGELLLEEELEEPGELLLEEELEEDETVTGSDHRRPTMTCKPNADLPSRRAAISAPDPPSMGG